MYKKLKDWLRAHKKEIYLTVGFFIIFGAGYGSGLGEKVDRDSTPKQLDYTTNDQNDKATTDNTKLQILNDKASPNNQNPNGLCKIKGTSSKIYHLPGGAFYDRVTNPAACFNTEAEAQAGGYRKSSR